MQRPTAHTSLGTKYGSFEGRAVISLCSRSTYYKHALVSKTWLEARYIKPYHGTLLFFLFAFSFSVRSSLAARQPLLEL